MPDPKPSRSMIDSNFQRILYQGCPARTQPHDAAQNPRDPALYKWPTRNAPRFSPYQRFAAQNRPFAHRTPPPTDSWILAPDSSTTLALWSCTCGCTCRWNRGSRHRDQRQTGIGFPGITSSVSTLRRILKIVLPIDSPYPGRSLHISEQAISFSIHIRFNMMSDLSGRMAEPDTAIEGNRA